MNNLNFQQLGGLPLETETLTEIQTAYSIFNAYGFLGGDRCIISGCIKTGNTVSNGFIFLDGEILEFKEGQEQSSVIVKQDVTDLEFENSEVKPVYYSRYACFGVGTSSVSWSDFKRLDSLTTLMTRISTLEKKSAVFSKGGGMLFWNKPANDIPVG